MADMPFAVVVQSISDPTKVLVVSRHRTKARAQQSHCLLSLTGLKPFLVQNCWWKTGATVSVDDAKRRWGLPPNEVEG